MSFLDMMRGPWAILPETLLELQSIYATLFGIAKDHGWRFPEAAPGQAVADKAAAEAAARARQEKHAAEEAELQRKREVSAARAQALWAGAAQQPTGGRCPYLERKGVKGYGLRYLPGGTALVSMCDEAGKLWSVQRLLPRPLKDRETGELGTDKLYGPPKASPDEQVSSRKLGLWHWIGAAPGAPVLLLAEGYATGATLHEATGRPVAVCFDAGNLVHVAKALRMLYPAALLLVCGDDDKPTEQRRGKNPGRLAATAAAFEVHSDAGPAAAVFPADLAEGQKDFNDLASTAGLDAVREQIEAAIAAPARPEAPKARQRAKSGAGGPNAGADRPALPPAPPVRPKGPASSPSGGYAGSEAEPDEWGFIVDRAGVWHCKWERGGWGRPIKLCAPLGVTARTRTDDSNAWGYYLEFEDDDGNAKAWAMPSALLSGEGSEWIARLRDMGLDVSTHPGVRTTLATYINTRKPAERITCTEKVGWHGSVYVLPGGSVGPEGAPRFVFQSEGPIEDNFRQRGRLSSWRDEVAAVCEGNTRLVFALGCAFAGPLLPFSGLEGGGFHLRGDSRGGKTTALRTAASVYGGEKFMQTWRATGNSLETTSVQHNHCLLVLDELGQLDPREAGDTAYMLSNGLDKGRATRGLLNRKRRAWRLLFLSSGEVGLADLMAEAGKRMRAGQEVRMVDVPLDAGMGMGGIETLHGFEGAPQLAEGLKEAALRFHGAAGRAWLQWCADRHDQLQGMVLEQLERHRSAFVPESAAGQVRTVGSRFALVATAGELATEAGITGWQPGEAVRSARACFEAWLGARGHLDNSEQVAMYRQVRSFLEKNGDALFTFTHDWARDRRSATPLRAGFKRYVDEQGTVLRIDAATEYTDKRAPASMIERNHSLIEHLVLPEAWRNDVCKGHSPDRVAAVLRSMGLLKHDPGKFTSRQRLPGMPDRSPCYVVLPKIFEVEL